MTSIVRVLELVRLDGDVFGLGLRSAIPDGAHTELKDHLLEARQAMLERLSGSADLSRLVEPFDPERYNSNASLAENLLFGSPVGPTFDPEHIADQPYVGETLEQTGLLADLYQVGYRLAQTMLELFADLPPEHEYFSQFSFIAPEDLPAYRALLTRADPAQLERLSARGPQAAAGADLQAHLQPPSSGADHARVDREGAGGAALLPRASAAAACGAIAFFEPTEYNVAITIQENVIFGKIAYGQAQASQRMAELLTDLLDKLDLRVGVMAVGLDSPVGIGGGRLSVAQRQKLGLARALVKRPDMLVLYDPLGPLDQREQLEVRDALLEAFGGPDRRLGIAARRLGGSVRSGDQARRGAGGRAGAAARCRGLRGRSQAKLLTAE